MATRTPVAPGQAPDADALRDWRIWTSWDAVRIPSWRNLAVAALVALVAFALSAAVVLRAPARYLSVATLVIDSPAELATSADDGPFNKLNQLRGKYASLASTTLILEPAARDAHLPLAEVARASVVSPAPKSLLMLSAATTGDPDHSRRIAQSVAESIADYVQREHARNNVPEAQRFRISIVADALPGVKTAPTTSRALLVGAGAAVAALAIAYVGLQLATGRRRLA